jgi:hypothetical protein
MFVIFDNLSHQTNFLFFQIVNPHNKNIPDVPGLAPPAQNYQIGNRRLLWAEAFRGI